MTSSQLLRRCLVVFPMTSSIASAEPVEPARPPPAATAVGRPGVHVSVETSPLSFTFFRGFEVGIGLRVPQLRHWRFRAFVDHEHIPQVFTDFDDRNKGWHVSDTFASLVADYYFKAGRGGLHVNASFAVSKTHLVAPSGNSVDGSQLGTRLGVAYQWFPFAHSGFYVGPWLFAIVLRPLSAATSMAGSETYYTPAVVPAGSLQIGYEL